LRQEVLKTKPAAGDHVLVYVTSPSTELADMLARIRHPFICYGFGLDGRDGRIVFKKPSLETFLLDLASCKAIVANSGFSLISEALYLEKPYLAIPVKHQFEQMLNAYYLDKCGFGTYWDDLEKERIESFLFNLDLYRENLTSYPREDNSALFAKLDSLIESNIH
jgi:uncharacterized protein (TIGR00661 family)